MIKITELSNTEIGSLSSLFLNSSEKSILERMYLFSQDPVEKAKIFCLCRRFIWNVYNLCEDAKLKGILKSECELTEKTYIDLCLYIEKYNQWEFSKQRYLSKIFYLVSQDEKSIKIVNDLIDVCSILLERESIIMVSKLKGVILDGESGKAFNKLMFDKDKKVHEEIIEEDFEEVDKKEEISSLEGYKEDIELDEEIIGATEDEGSEEKDKV